MIESDQDYRESEEWREVERAVQNLVHALEDFNEESRSMNDSFVLSVAKIDVEGETRGGYSHYSTSPAPHVNEGIHRQGVRYWSSLFTYEEKSQE